jgi:hypothetical protein
VAQVAGGVGSYVLPHHGLCGACTGFTVWRFCWAWGLVFLDGWDSDDFGSMKWVPWSVEIVE